MRRNRRIIREYTVPTARGRNRYRRPEGWARLLRWANAWLTIARAYGWRMVLRVVGQGVRRGCCIRPPQTVLLTGSFIDTRLLGLEHGSLAGAAVRLRYTVDADHRDVARAQAAEWRTRILAAGAVSCEVEEVVSPTTCACAVWSA